MASEDEIATLICYLTARIALYAPWANYNEGQKVLIEEYTDIDVDVSIKIDQQFPFYTVELNSFYIDIEGTHEEAFGSLYDDVEEIVQYFAEEVFNFEGNVFEVGEFMDNFQDAVQYTERKIAVFA
jgi:hypothetical protein